MHLLVFRFVNWDYFNIFVNNQNTTGMKSRIFFALAIVGLLSACTQYTCPTYAKKEVKKAEKQEITKEKI
jgi:hypothetical protein